MSAQTKLFGKILKGAADANIPFFGLCQLLKKMGFDERTRGDHHIFTKTDIEEIINLQPKNSKAKPYQVKQVCQLMTKYKLELEEKDD